jgi:hypothetical protein
VQIFFFFSWAGKRRRRTGKTNDGGYKTKEVRKATDRGKRRGRIQLEEKEREAAREGTCERGGQQQVRSQRRIKEGRSLKAEIIASIA